MYELIDLKAATSRRWDVVIVGSSFAGVFFAHGLPKTLSILMVEKGPIVSHGRWLEESNRFLEPIPQRNTTWERKKWVAHSLFGGNSNCWWACTPRFMPTDFEMRTRYGVGRDWPLGYDDLEPYYEEVEDLMDIAGGGSDHVLPRRRPFPYPPHAPSDSDRLLRAHSRNWCAQPTARANGGPRASCCANGICNRCPIDSKFTITNTADRLFHPGIAVLPEAEVRTIVIEGGAATGVAGRAGGADFEIRADLVALGANALFNAAIMLRSGLTHPWLGGGLTEQVARSVSIYGPPELGLYGGTSITGHGYGLYDGPHRKERAAILTEVWNSPTHVRAEFGRWTDAVTMKFVAEDLPRQENRVVIEDDEPFVEWNGHDRYALDALDRAVDDIAEHLPFAPEAIHDLVRLTATEAHILGTHRMGDDPAETVIDRNMRCHQTAGLLALGGGAFPTCSPANPTLTLSALSLRAARLL